MNGNRPLNSHSRLFIALLVLSVAVNSTQAVVLCAGCDGHVAVEMAGHHHCHNTNDCQEASHEAGDDADEHETPCRLCVDIPLSPGIADGPGLKKMPLMNALFAGLAPSIPDMSYHGPEAFAAAGACSAFTSFYDPLSSIILIV